MDCKLENAIRTLLRIEAILFQGFVRGVFSSIMLILSIPVAPFCLTYLRFKQSKVALGRIRRFLMIPLWFIQSFVISLMAPIMNILSMAISMKDVAMVEWVNRWMASTPKKPNGHPLDMDENEKEFLDRAVMESVLHDYGEHL